MNRGISKNHKEKKIVWESPVAHAIEEVLKDYEMSIEDVLACQEAQLIIEIAWQIEMKLSK